MSKYILSNAELNIEARDWVADCTQRFDAYNVPAERILAYITANYDGGWDAFVEASAPVALPSLAPVVPCEWVHRGDGCQAGPDSTPATAKMYVKSGVGGRVGNLCGFHSPYDEIDGIRTLPPREDDGGFMETDSQPAAPAFTTGLVSEAERQYHDGLISRGYLATMVAEVAERSAGTVSLVRNNGAYRSGLITSTGDRYRESLVARGYRPHMIDKIMGLSASVPVAWFSDQER